jgi:hypothetical protein
MSMIALLELALRNATNHQLVIDFGDENWLVSEKSPVPLKAFERKAVAAAIGHAQRAAYAKLNHKEKAWLDAFAFPSGVPSGMKHKTVVSKRQRLFVVSHGQVISQTTFSFWKRLYSNDYESVLWKRSLKRVFPNKVLKRSDISSNLETVYAIRNRVAHHEPVYGARLSEAMSALEFLRESLGASSKHEETSFKKFSRVQNLRLRMDYESYLEAWESLT